MPKREKSLWERIRQHFRVPTFQEVLDESTEGMKERPILADCPRCGQAVPLGKPCPKCGSPRYPTIDERA